MKTLRKDAAFAVWCGLTVVWCLGVLLFYGMGVAAEGEQRHGLALEERVKSLEVQLGAMHGEVYGLGVRVKVLEQHPKERKAQ